MFNGYAEAVKRKREILQKQKNSILEIETHKDKIRELFTIRTAKPQESLSSPILGVDSAFAISRQILSNFYVSIPVSVTLKDGSVSIEDTCYVEEDGNYLENILKAISLSGEIRLAAERLNECSYVFLDGSVSTFMVTLSSGISAALKHKDSAVAKHFLQIYPDTIYSFKDILTSGKAIFVPKSSQKTDLRDYILTRTDLPQIEHISDYGIVMFILEKTEYLKVGTAKLEDYKSNKEWIKDIILYDTLNELEEIAQAPEVYYMRGLSGYPFKFECFCSFPADIALPMTANKEFYITYEADMEAKDRIQPILIPESVYEEGVRL